MPDPRQLLLLAVAVGVPCVLLWQRREDTLLVWLGVCVGIQLFDTNVGINLPAARIAGLLLVPLQLAHVGALLRARPLRWLGAQFAWYLVLALVFGLLFPWSTQGTERTFAQSALGRSLVFMVRTVADLSILAFVARVVAERGTPVAALRAILRGVAIAGVAGFAEFLLRIDFYGALTGLRSLSLDRMRGLNYEPRALGLISAHGLLLSLALAAWGSAVRVRWFVAIALLGLAVSVSSSALAALAAGLGMLVLADGRARTQVLRAGVPAGLLLTLVGGAAAATPVGEVWITNVTDRFGAARFDVVADSWLEVVAFGLDIFDASALSFFIAKPGFAVLGSGPGLVSIPATEFVPDNPVFRWARESTSGVNALPTMGFLFELGNGGVLGLLLWMGAVTSCWSACRRLARRELAAASEWRATGTIILVAAACFLVQVSPLSALWPMLLGLGAAASLRLAAVEQFPLTPPPDGLT